MLFSLSQCCCFGTLQCMHRTFWWARSIYYSPGVDSCFTLVFWCWCITVVGLLGSWWQKLRSEAWHTLSIEWWSWPGVATLQVDRLRGWGRFWFPHSPWTIPVCWGLIPPLWLQIVGQVVPVGLALRRRMWLDDGYYQLGGVCGGGAGHGQLRLWDYTVDRGYRDRGGSCPLHCINCCVGLWGSNTGHVEVLESEFRIRCEGRELVCLASSGVGRRVSWWCTVA